MAARSLPATGLTGPQPFSLVTGGLGATIMNPSNPKRGAVVVRRGDAHLVPVISERCLLVEVLPDGSRRPAIRGGFGESDEQASTFSNPDDAAFFAVNVLRARGVDAILDIEPIRN